MIKCLLLFRRALSVVTTENDSLVVINVYILKCKQIFSLLCINYMITPHVLAVVSELNRKVTSVAAKLIMLFSRWLTINTNPQNIVVIINGVIQAWFAASLFFKTRKL